MSRTNALTQSVIKLMNMSGYNVWRNNNVAVYDKKIDAFRAGHTKKGVSDIIGYRKNDGKAVYVEIKTGKDRLSVEQAYFMDEASKSGCITIVCRSIDDVLNYLSQTKQ